MFKEELKKIDRLDVGLIKATSVAFILFLVTVWPAAMSLVHSIHWGWFLAATVIFGARPLIKAYKK